MVKPLYLFRPRLLNAARFRTIYVGKRMLLSQAYKCEEMWSKRLDSPLLRNIKMDQYFIDTDKKFGTKNLVSGVDIDLFACSVQDADQLDELEHLLYRFRRTKRSVELMDSTTYAVVRIFLHFKNYEALFRILNDPENYGIFPDLCSYNILMDTFIEENLPKEAMQVAVLMMLQEDFSNEIGQLLALHSCYTYLKQSDLYSPEPEKPVEEEQEYGDEEEQLVRVPFIRNPYFDDHFHLTNPRHLIGKTFFLAGRAMQKDVLGRSYQLLGLAMYEKWEDALQLLKSLDGADENPVLLSGGIEEFKKFLHFLKNEDLRKQFEDLFSKLQADNRIETGDLEHHVSVRMQDLSALEERDILQQRKWFSEWEQKRAMALEKQNLEIELQERLKKIEEKKIDLYWKEKHLFFFENEAKILKEYENAQGKSALQESEESKVDTYLPPEIRKMPRKPQTRYQRLARVKKL